MGVEIVSAGRELYSYILVCPLVDGIACLLAGMDKMQFCPTGEIIDKQSVYAILIAYKFEKQTSMCDR